MSEMIERVAKAILEEQRKNRSGFPDNRDLARAAIEAMREPTEDLWDAGATSLYGHPRERAVEFAKEDKFESDGHRACEVWQAMIDEALK